MEPLNEKNPSVDGGLTKMVASNVARSFLSELLSFVDSEYDPESHTKLKDGIVNLAVQFGLSEDELKLNTNPVNLQLSEIKFVATEVEKQFLIAYGEEYQRLITEAVNKSKDNMQACFIKMAALAKIYLGGLMEKKALNVYHYDVLAKAYRDYWFSGKPIYGAIKDKYYLLLFMSLGDAIRKNESVFAGNLYMEIPFEHALDGLLNFSIEQNVGKIKNKLSYSIQAMNKTKHILFKELDEIIEAKRKQLIDEMYAKGNGHMN